MAVFAFYASAAVTARTAWTPPSGVGQPSRTLQVRSIMIQPAASGTQALNGIQEIGVGSGGGASAGGAASAGQCTFLPATQQFVSGDAIPVNGLVIVNCVADGEQPVNP